MISKPVNESYVIIKELVTNNFKCSSKRVNPKKVAIIHDIDALSILTSQVATISRKLDHLGLNGNKVTLINLEENSYLHIGEYGTSNLEFLKSINRKNNPYSNTYNLD